MLYVLDEPSIGLHQRDNRKLLATLGRLRDLGNTVVVVEHDEETIRAADYVVDLGPGAGELGGQVIFQGSPAELIGNGHGSLTGAYLGGQSAIETPKARRKEAKGEIVIRGARANNLKDVDVKIPLGRLVAVTGVSGSGKSTLVNDILYKSLAREFYRAADEPGAHDKIEGINLIDKVIEIDQSPIGRTPRSNPATYTSLFTFIRELFAMVPEARTRGFKPGRFSFNVKGGRCEACQGDGVIAIEMHFLPNVYVTCEQCKGRRYNRETLEIKYRGKSIADVLDLTVDQALPLLENFPPIATKLRTLQSVGLGYITLGQSATTLSGGEAQRVKLSRELSKRGTGRTLYILDEPTTGLHFEDVRKLLDVLDAARRAGQHHRRDRAQPRRDQVGRLADRSRARRRRGRRQGRRAGHARAGGQGQGLGDRPVSGRNAEVSADVGAWHQPRSALVPGSTDTCGRIDTVRAFASVAGQTQP